MEFLQLHYPPFIMLTLRRRCYSCHLFTTPWVTIQPVLLNHAQSVPSIISALIGTPLTPG